MYPPPKSSSSDRLLYYKKCYENSIYLSLNKCCQKYSSELIVVFLTDSISRLPR